MKSSNKPIIILMIVRIPVIFYKNVNWRNWIMVKKTKKYIYFRARRSHNNEIL